MKYENEINEFINVAFPKEDWMNDKDYNEIIEQSLNHLGITKQKLSDEIEVGVKNGYPVEQQLDLLKQVLNNKTL